MTNKHEKPDETMTLEPTAGVLPVENLKSLENWRAFFHQAVTIIVPVLVVMNVATQSQVTAWLPFLFAVVDNVLSVGSTADRLRRAIYAGIGVLQTGGLITVLFASVPQYIPIAGAVLAVGSAFMARFYTPTTTIVPVMKAE